MRHVIARINVSGWWHSWTGLRGPCKQDPESNPFFSLPTLIIDLVCPKEYWKSFCRRCSLIGPLCPLASFWSAGQPSEQKHPPSRCCCDFKGFSLKLTFFVLWIFHTLVLCPDCRNYFCGPGFRGKVWIVIKKVGTLCKSWQTFSVFCWIRSFFPHKATSLYPRKQWRKKEWGDVPLLMKDFQPVLKNVKCLLASIQIEAAQYKWTV